MLLPSAMNSAGRCLVSFATVARGVRNVSTRYSRPGMRRIAPLLGVDTINIGEEFFLGESGLGHVDQVRPILRRMPGKSGGGGEKTGMAAHDDVHLDSRQRAIVKIVADHRGGDELGGRAEAR